jgi:hypothetical protein
MQKATLRLAVVLGLAAGLTACGQEASMTGSGPKADQKSSAAEDNGYLEKTFPSGDKASWESQLKARAQYGQNDYSRVN